MRRSDMPRTVAPLLVLFVCLCAPARSDTVVFKSGRRLQGCKVTEFSDTRIVLVFGEGEVGRLVLDAGLVDEVEYDYESRLAALEDDDALGHYELGVWCVEQEMFREARERFAHAWGVAEESADVQLPAEMHFYLGVVYENMLDPDPAKALEQYRAYLDVVPEIEENAERIAEATAAVERLAPDVPDEPDPEPKDPVPDEPPPPVEAPEGFETGPWRHAGWSNVAVCKTVRDTQNDTALLAAKFVGHDDKNVRQDKAPIQLPFEGADRDCSDRPVLTMDVIHTEETPLRIAVAVQAGHDHEWYESPLVSIRGGEWKQDQRFDLTRRSWKSQKTGWRHRAAVDPLNDIRNIYILVYNGGAEGTIYFDDMRFVPVEGE